MLEINNRMPTFMGDLQAMIGSNMIGKRRIMEFLEKYGREAVADSLEYVYDYAERRFRAEIREWPDGIYEGEAFIEHDGQGTRDIRIHAHITIEGDEITVDMSGSDPQVPGFINSSLANVYSWVYVSFCCMIDPDIPKNDGLFRPVNLIAPKGTIVNPQEPAPCTACTLHVGGEIAEAVAHAMAQAVPGKAFNQNFKIGIPIITQGINPRTGDYFIDLNLDNMGGSCNAAYGVDAWGITPPVLAAITSTSVEMTDLLFPTRHHGWEYTTDSGGPGKWRGVCGPWSNKEALAHIKATYFIIANRFPMRGLNGGGTGGLARYVLRHGSPQEMILEEVGVDEPLEPGHFYYTQYPGGGGWGDPLERRPELVREDVLDEYVSIEGARRDYGVIIDPERLEIDITATETLRRQMKSQE
jgi:N-methylhydantoinase B